MTIEIARNSSKDSFSSRPRSNRFTTISLSSFRDAFFSTNRSSDLLSEESKKKSFLISLFCCFKQNKQQSSNSSLEF